MKVSVIIPNYNGEALLKENLPKVLEAMGGGSEIIIVDDGSKDKSAFIVLNIKSKSKIPIRLLKNEQNTGFSSTVNKGVRKAKGDIVFLLNTDAYPDKDFLKPLIEDFKNPNVFAVGCLDKSLENGKTILRGRGIGKWEKGFLVHSKGRTDKNNTLWASGGSSAFRKSLWNKLGGMDEIYDPFYWEDIDICYRALKSGYKVFFDPRSVIFHEHNKGAIRRSYSEFGIRAIAYKNQFIFVWKNATDLSLQIKHVLFLPYHFVRAVKNRDLAFFVGFFKAFVLLPKIIKSSFKVQKAFILSDSKLIEGFKQ